MPSRACNHMHPGCNHAHQALPPHKLQPHVPRLQPPTAPRASGTCMTLVGAVVFAFVVSNVAELVHEINAQVNQNRARMESINAYMRYRGLPATLQVGM